MKIIAKLALATLVAPVALAASEASAQKLTFTLNWVAGGDHAPYFYAQKMGYYKQASRMANWVVCTPTASPPAPASR